MGGPDEEGVVAWDGAEYPGDSEVSLDPKAIVLDSEDVPTMWPLDRVTDLGVEEVDAVESPARLGSVLVESAVPDADNSVIEVEASDGFFDNEDVCAGIIGVVDVLGEVTGAVGPALSATN